MRLPIAIPCSLLFALTLTPCLSAQESSEAETAVRYDGHRLVRVQLNDDRDIETMVAISQDHWSEGLGVGAFDFRVAPERLVDLELSGLRYSVLHDDVQELVDESLSSPEALGPFAGSWFSAYKTRAEYDQQLDALVALNPMIASRSVIGQSLEGRDIWLLTITGAGGTTGKPAVLFNSLQHAREWVAGMTTMYIADRLVKDYGTNAAITALLDEVVVYIVPIVNPDGYEYTWTDERLWRKNRRDNGDGTIGVDTNRNFATGWGGGGSAGNGDSNTYRGTEPFSEPETQALRDFLLAHPEVECHVDFHAYSQLLLSPYGFDFIEPAEPDATSFRLLNHAMQGAIEDVNGVTYTTGPGALTLYQASGIFPDWSYEERGAYAWTIELRPSSSSPGFLLPPEEILPTAEENLPAALYLMAFARRPLAFFFPSGMPTVLNAGRTTPVDVHLAEVAGELMPNSLTLYARGPESTQFLLIAGDGGPGMHRCLLPPTGCGRTLEFYFEAMTTGGQLVRYPESGMLRATASRSRIEFADAMETDQGWTVGAPGDTATTGIWERVVPQATDAQPGEDHTPDPQGSLCWVTGGSGGSIGGNDVDGGATTLISPTFDASSPETQVRYWLWYTNVGGQSPGQDVFQVDVSTDGTTWVPVQTVGPTGPDATGGWVLHEFRVADFVAPSSTLQVRFVAADSDSPSIVEAALDDFEVFVDEDCLPQRTITPGPDRALGGGTEPAPQ